MQGLPEFLQGNESDLEKRFAEELKSIRKRKLEAVRNSNNRVSTPASHGRSIAVQGDAMGKGDKRTTEGQDLPRHPTARRGRTIRTRRRRSGKQRTEAPAVAADC